MQAAGPVDVDLVDGRGRAQAEMLFQDFWRMNDDNLAIALHHGSLDVAQRRKVEDAMAAGKLRGVVVNADSQQLFAEKSGHNVHLDQPDAAVGAIVKMVEQIRRPLAP